MKIAIISDTHDNISNVQAVRQLILAEGVDAIVHCGDLTDTSVLGYFGDFQLYYTFGNCDLAGIIRDELHLQGDRIQTGYDLSLNLNGKRVYVTHGHIDGYLEKAIASGNYDYIFHGHTHQFVDELSGKTRIINPGALGGKKVDTCSFAFLDLESGLLTRVCEPFDNKQ